MTEQRDRLLRGLPAVHVMMDDERIQRASAGANPAIVRDVIRECLDAARARILSDSLDQQPALVEQIIHQLDLLLGSRPTSVINGTGVIVQTNLGRAPVSASAAQEMAKAAASYVALETDLESGQRGGRGHEVEALLRALTGAERALVVNNNAAAVMLVLASLSAGRGVIVSRGEAVEIGGGFRVPDVLRQSGARLVEVGTTNRTYARDYSEAIDDDTAAILRVHASNFEIIGFTARPELDDLVALCRERNVLLIEDVGSGCLLDTRPFGLAHEPTLGESIRAGVDIVCASGDKLLGGPQAGIILGRAAVVDQVARHPLARALRADKTCLAGLAATLRHYIRDEATDEIPVWWAISRTPEWLERRARRWSQALGDCAEVVRTDAVVGGGSLPGKLLPSFGIAISAGSLNVQQLAQRLRIGDQPVVPRVVDERLIIDARTVLADQEEALIDALRAALTI